MKHPPVDDDTAMPADGFDAHAQQERLRWLRASPAERLAWLEDAMAFAARHRGAAGAHAGTQTDD